MNTEEMITIPKKEYEQLCEDSEFYHALRSAGVDNWDGWDYALEILEGWNNENDLKTD
jgi:hypothetical protein